MNLAAQRRLAAEILKVGVHRVWLDPDRLDDIASAVTREDIRRLIREGAIAVKPIKGTSRVRARIRHEQRKKGRRRGHGKRKGKKTARLSRKEKWMNTIRAIRKFLRKLRDKGQISRSDYRKLYRMAKGGAFRSVSHLRMYMVNAGILKSE